MNRREFLTAGGGVLLAGAAGTYAVRQLAQIGASQEDRVAGASGRKWGMVVDLRKCRPDCTACLEACRLENNTAWVGDARWDVHWIRKVHVKPKNGGTERSVVLVCNHCDHPPCAQVCPVQATYKRADGIVIVDHHRCIGCRYCMIACPYNARYFNFKESEEWPNKDFPKRSHGVAESCTLCAHLLDIGKKPACVQACERVQAGALVVGNLNDPQSEIARLVAENPVKRLREDLGTEPKVYYIGL